MFEKQFAMTQLHCFRYGKPMSDTVTRLLSLGRHHRTRLSNGGNPWDFAGGVTRRSKVRPGRVTVDETASARVQSHSLERFASMIVTCGKRLRILAGFPTRSANSATPHAANGSFLAIFQYYQSEISIWKMVDSHGRKQLRRIIKVVRNGHGFDQTLCLVASHMNALPMVGPGSMLSDSDVNKQHGFDQGCFARNKPVLTHQDGITLVWQRQVNIVSRSKIALHQWPIRSIRIIEAHLCCLRSHHTASLNSDQDHHRNGNQDRMMQTMPRRVFFSWAGFPGIRGIGV